MTTKRSRKAFLRQINLLKDQIHSLEKKIIQTEIIIYEYNKMLAYHDKFKESGFRKVTKEKIRREVEQLHHSKFHIIEELLEKRHSLSTLRQGSKRLAS